MHELELFIYGNNVAEFALVTKSKVRKYTALPNCLVCFQSMLLIFCMLGPSLLA